MKTVLVAGGAGEVGEGIVRQLLAAGHRVIVQSRSAAKIAELMARLPDSSNLVMQVSDIASESDVEAMRDSIAGKGYELDAVVASVGSWWSGPQLVDLDTATFREVMDERLMTHFYLAKVLLPSLAKREGSSYVFIHSAAGFVPIPGSGPVSIAGAAQAMMKEVFAKENPGQRISLLTMMGSIGTRSFPASDPEALTNDDVGRYVAWLVGDSGVAGSIRFTHRRELPTG